METTFDETEYDKKMQEVYVCPFLMLTAPYRRRDRLLAGQRELMAIVIRAGRGIWRTW